MRTLVFGALALGSGCNWVFGLDPVRLTDAQIIDAPPDAPLPTVKLSAITPMLTANGTLTGQAAFVPISPAPMVQYGRRGEALIDTTYVDQNVPVGYDLAESADIWRLVYTLPGRVPHEIHWQPSESSRPGHAVVLQLTPNDREAVPAGATLTLSPMSPPTWSFPRIYTTNTWTITPVPDRSSTSVSTVFDSASTIAMAGAKRKPDPLKDYEVVVDYRLSPADARCTVASGSAAFHIDLATGLDDGLPQTFKADPKPGDYRVATSNPDDPRFNLGLANGLNPISDVTTLQFITYGPAGAIPLHSHTESIGAGDLVPVPAGILLATCTDGPDTVPTFGYPSRVPLPTIATLMFSTTPIPVGSGGPSVRNVVSGSMVGDLGPFNLIFTNLGFPVEPTVDGTSVNITNTTPTAIPAGDTTAALDFMLAGSAPLVDLFEATLYKVEGNALVPLREYTFTERPLRFDRATGQPAGTRYVFAIRAIRGVANTANADFSVWGNTQWLGVTHTQAFTLN